jgi:hypothetical protein
MAWKPMRSAPLNWSHVLVVDKRTREVCEAYFRDDECVWCRANLSPGDEDAIIRPSHWMPLPNPPEGK